MTDFIIGRIGGKELIKESIKSFISETKEVDWTTNQIYKAATNSEIKPSFKTTKNEEKAILSKFDLSSIEKYKVDTSKISSFTEFIGVEQERNAKINEKIEVFRNKSLSIIDKNYGLSSFSMSKQEMISQLKSNWKKVALSNYELSQLLAPYKVWLSQSNNQ